MQTVTVCERGEDITFEGELLGESTSRDEGKQRWAEMRLYRKADGTYALVGCGRSTMPGEHDTWWVREARRPRQLMRYLQRVDREGVKFLPYVAEDLLEAASVNDELVKELVNTLSY